SAPISRPTRWRWASTRRTCSARRKSGRTCRRRGAAPVRAGLKRLSRHSQGGKMKRIEISQYGVPEDIARCVEAPDLGPPADDEVVFTVLVFPINPADVLFCRGLYRLKPPLPTVPGAECVG